MLRLQKLTALRTQLVIVLATCLLATGCVRRRLTVRTNPGGARGYVDDRQIGVTPFSTEFTYYGTRKIHLERDGMESVTIERTLHAPWYQWPVIDFFAENLWPWEIRDEREIVVQMQPLAPVEPDALLSRAGQMRGESQMGIAGQQLTPTEIPPATVPLNADGTPRQGRHGLGQHRPLLGNPQRPRLVTPYQGPPTSYRPTGPPPVDSDPNLIQPTW